MVKKSLSDGITFESSPGQHKNEVWGQILERLNVKYKMQKQAGMRLPYLKNMRLIWLKQNEHRRGRSLRKKSPDHSGHGEILHFDCVMRRQMGQMNDTVCFTFSKIL